MPYSYEDLYNNLKDQAERQGITVLLSKNGQLKDYVGMNEYAAKSLGLKFPKDTIAIKSGLSMKAKYHTLRHEMIERRKMSKGDSYWQAHTYALTKEDEIIRKGLEKK